MRFKELSKMRIMIRICQQIHLIGKNLSVPSLQKAKKIIMTKPHVPMLVSVLTLVSINSISRRFSSLRKQVVIIPRWNYHLLIMMGERYLARSCLHLLHRLALSLLQYLVLFL
ncbi:unnamed protein product [Musa acuminata subsp. burmannicoides]